MSVEITTDSEHYSKTVILSHPTQGYSHPFFHPEHTYIHTASKSNDACSIIDTTQTPSITIKPAKDKEKGRNPIKTQ